MSTTQLNGGSGLLDGQSIHDLLSSEADAAENAAAVTGLFLRRAAADLDATYPVWRTKEHGPALLGACVQASSSHLAHWAMMVASGNIRGGLEDSAKTYVEGVEQLGVVLTSKS